MTKRFLSIILAAIMLLSASPLNAFAATADEAAPVAAEVDKAADGATSGTTGDCSWSYDASTKGLKITGSGKMADYERSSDTPWSEYLSTAQSIVIDTGVTYVGTYCFSNTKATAITMADTVTEIANDAFSNASKANTCKLSATLTTIGDDAFSGLGVTGLTIPKKVTKVGAQTFTRCDNLKFLTIPDACACDFDWYNFSNCTALESVSIGKNAVISENCFAHCPSLKNFQVSADNPYYSTGNGHLFSKDKKELLFYCNGNGATSSEFSSSIIELGDYALSGNPTLTTLTLPAGIKKIGKHTFENSVLTNLSFRGTALQEIGDSAFWGTPFKKNLPDSGLIYIGTVAYLYKGDAPNSLTLRSGTKGIADGCFKNQMTLEKITLPDSLLHIGGYAFYQCENLTDVSFPDKLQSIGEWAFYFCKTMTQVSLPDSVKEIGKQCFRTCRGIKQLRLSPNLTEIPYLAFNMCDAVEGDLDIPEKVERIGCGAFYMCGASTITVKNRNTVFEDGDLRIVSNKLRGYHDSTAEAYALSHYTTFVPIDKRVSGVLQTYLNDQERTKLVLKNLQTTEIVAELSVVGNAYTFNDVDAAYYSLTVSKKNHVGRTYDVWVKEKDFVQDVVICPIGDISGDGKVTTKDYAMANAHAQKVSLLTDYALKCGDVLKNDGKVTTADAARINAAAQKVDPLW